MPVVRRNERRAGLEPIRGGYKQQPATTALAEGAGVEEAKIQTLGAIAQVGDRLQRIGLETYTRLRTEEKAAADQTAVLAWSNGYAAWKNRRIYDPKTGAFTLKGKNAQTLPEDVMGESDVIMADLDKSLTNAEQRAAVARLKAQERQQLDLSVRRYTLQEQEAYQAQELKNHVDNSVNEAVGSYLDPKLVEVNLQKAVGALQGTLPGMGVGPEGVKAAVLDTTTKTHVGVIANLLAAEKSTEAELYFQSNKAAIDPEQHDDVAAALDEGSVRAQSQGEADDIIAKGGTLTEQLERAAKIPNTKVRDAVEDRLRQHKSDVDRVKLDQQRADELKATNILDRMGLGAADVSAIPPALWVSFDLGTKANMRQYAKQVREGEPVETDYDLYYALMTTAGTKPAAFLDMKLTSYKSRLADGDFERLTNIQYNIRTAPENAKKELSPFLTRHQLLDATLVTYGYGPGMTNEAEQKKTPQALAVQQIRREVDKQVELAQTAKEAELSNTEVQQIIDNVLMQSTTIPGRIYGSTDKRLVDLTIRDVPPAARKIIEEALAGTRYNDQTILRMYRERLRRGMVK